MQRDSLDQYLKGSSVAKAKASFWSKLRHLLDSSVHTDGVSSLARGRSPPFHTWSHQKGRGVMMGTPETGKLNGHFWAFFLWLNLRDRGRSKQDPILSPQITAHSWYGLGSHEGREKRACPVWPAITANKHKQMQTPACPIHQTDTSQIKEGEQLRLTCPRRLFGLSVEAETDFYAAAERAKTGLDVMWRAEIETIGNGERMHRRDIFTLLILTSVRRPPPQPTSRIFNPARGLPGCFLKCTLSRLSLRTQDQFQISVITYKYQI